MKQLTQKLKDGQLKVVEVVPPALLPGMVLVRNHYSLISAGTESSTVSTARKSLIGKARERPQQVKQVIDVLTQQGPVQTWRAVMKKLEAHSPLGYSSAGVVVDVAPDVKGFAPGDRVACGGIGYANHAEIVAVPVNLCVKLAPDARLDLAAYNTVAAIALQGIRQADVRLGETCVVIGLGLIGQLTALMLRAAGVRVVGIDISAAVTEIAAKHCADLAMTRETPGLAERVDELTGGIGADCAIITAATSSTDPVNLAGRLLRKKGRVVIVGAVPTGFDRDPYYYRKELELVMSCSYGPGRYDPSYEEKGIDYPPGYVRWTEQRNMAAFQELVRSGRLEMDYLTTHCFPLEEAPGAYDLILGREEPYLGILIQYDAEKPIAEAPLRVGTPRKRGRSNVAFIGTGSYAQSHLLPNLPPAPEVTRRVVLNASGTTSRSAQDRYGFELSTSKEEEIFGSPEVDTVFVATRHDSHAHYVLKAIESGKDLFVEKPLAITPGELQAVHDALATAGQGGAMARLMVGFNRRFSPLTEFVKERIAAGPATLLYRVNAGTIPADSWIQDPEVGGGRIIGEVCHFVDLLQHFSAGRPVSVYALAAADPAEREDNVTLTVGFSDGTVGTICYYTGGSKAVPKEYIEVHRAGVTGIIRDCRTAEGYGSGRQPEKKKLRAQDKGQRTMVRAFFDAIQAGREAPIPMQQILDTTLVTLAAVKSLRERRAISLVADEGNDG